jgi:redox-sensitive bicupin YhaK (pirin superfamily)
MTAGGGVQHSEMFPLLHRERDNTMELFQIWLNLPRKNKMVDAHFKMFWSEKIPSLTQDQGRVSISLIAGELGEGAEKRLALAPPPKSWASEPENEVTILLVKLKAGGTFRLPATRALANRTLYLFEGKSVEVSSGSGPAEAVSNKTGLILQSQSELVVKAAADGTEFSRHARSGSPPFSMGRLS